MEKTLGQIAYDRRQQYYRDAQFYNWAPIEWDFQGEHVKRAEQAAADAVVERCAKEICLGCLEGSQLVKRDVPHDKRWYHIDKENGYRFTCQAQKILVLLEASSDAGLKSPKGDTATAQPADASLTPNSPESSE